MERVELKLERAPNVCAVGRNGGFVPRTITVSPYNTGIGIEVESRRTGIRAPVFLSLTKADAEALARAILGGPTGDLSDIVLFDDVLNMCENEGIDAKVFTEHPDLKGRVLLFDYDHQDYNDELQEHLEDEAEKLGIDLEQYRADWKK